MGRSINHRHILQGIALVLFASALAGCDSTPSGFPTELTFPARKDRLVVKLPERAPIALGEPGHLEEELARLDELGGKTYDPVMLSETQRQPLERYLLESFGTPAVPVIRWEDLGILGLTPDRLAEGSRLYRRQCMNCHGLSGDSRGPTGNWIYPHPRDFRRGAFKFITKPDSPRPSRADLLRVVETGIRGTAMPSFALLPESDRERMVDFVMYLSIRGQVEYDTLSMLLADEDDIDISCHAATRLRSAIAAWQRGSESSPGAEATIGDLGEVGNAVSIRRGYELFTSKSAVGCISCHEDFGRKATYRYDIWGTVVRPADLTAAVYKGGNRPIDFANRIRNGIGPSGMPAHPNLTETQLGDLVRLIRSLPYPRELPPDIRSRVYPDH